MVLLAGLLLLAVAGGTAAAQEATNVTVVVEPQETVAGEPINGSPTVMVTDDLGVPVPSAEIRAIVAEGPGGFASGSTIEYTDANGEIAFDDLVLDEPGSYRLEFRATSGTATPATTDVFDVVADPDSIQDMVDAADPGDTIAIAPGTYVENVTVDTANLTITAAGEERPHVEGGFLIRADNVTIGDLNITGGYANSFGVGSETANVTIAVTGTEISDTGGHGIAVDGADAVTVTGAAIRNVTEHGLVITRTGNITVDGVAVQRADRVGIGVEQAWGTVAVEGGIVSEAGEHGILVLGGTATSVTDVIVEDAGGLGIGIGEVAGPVAVEGAAVSDSGDRGVIIEGATGVTVTGVAVQNTGGTGAAVFDVGDVDLSSSFIQNTSGSGIRVDGAADVTVDETIIRESAGNGLAIWDAAGVAVSGMDIQESGSLGVGVVGASGDVTVTDTAIAGAFEAGVLASGVEGVTVTGVDIKAVGAGISVSSAGAVAFSETSIQGTKWAGIETWRTDDVTVTSAIIRDAGDHGIRITTADLATVTDSVLVSAGTGVAIENVTAATISGSHIENTTVGVRNVDNATTIAAPNNWWGASDGPGGEGPGHGVPAIGDIAFGSFQTITAVDAFAVGPGFAGVVHDDGGIPVSASGFATDEHDIEFGVALLEIDGQVVPVTIADGVVNATVNLADALGPETETGMVTADLEGLRQDEIRLVHEAHTLDEGYTRWSIPQPAALYTTDGVTDVTQWSNDASTYDDAGFSTDDGSLITDGADLHRGMFVYAETDGERLGYDFATPGEASLPPGGAEPIGEGWNLLGSNYDLSSNDHVELNHDLATVTNLPATAGDYTGEDPVVAYDPRSYNRLGGTHAVGHYETYWVYVDVGQPTEFRAITAPEYDPADGE